MRYSGSEEGARPKVQRAAVFVDYENLYDELARRAGSRERPEELLGQMLDELRRYLTDDLRTQPALVNAYADFSDLRGNGQLIQQMLYHQGVEARFVPSTFQRNASEIQLCVDVLSTLHTRPDIGTIVLLTGSRIYLPLVQQIKRHGPQPFVVTLSPPPAAANLPLVEDDVFIDALELINEGSRRVLVSDPASRGRSNGTAPPAPAQAPARPQPVRHTSLTTDGARRALDVIEEYFGQYEEVYLTPLLRKLSEVLDENRFDPKSLISELEDAGAVWLEKRRGFPYDYTVLLVDPEHPDVQASQTRGQERRSSAAPYEDYVESETEGDDYYVDDDYEDEDEDALDEYYNDEVEEYDDEYAEDEVYLDDEEEKEDLP